MKLLLDQNVYFELAAKLREAGIEATHTRELGWGRLSDEELIAAAAREGWIVVTHDEDFHALLALGGETSPSVIRLRVFLELSAMAQLIAEVLKSCGSALTAGAAILVKERSVQVHLLPLK